MIHLEKTYKFPIANNEIKEKRFTIHYGFDEELIKSFPKDINEGKFLFMFVDVKDSQWFRENTNDNPNIMVINLNVDENNLSEEILERIVDKIVEQQKIALSKHWEIQE